MKPPKDNRPFWALAECELTLDSVTRYKAVFTDSPDIERKSIELEVPRATWVALDAPTVIRVGVAR